MEFAQRGKDTPIAAGLMLVALLVSPGVAFAAPPGGSTKSRINALEAQVSALEAQVEALVTFVQAVEPFITVNPDPINGLAGPHVIFEGANVHVRSGSGATNDGWNYPDPPPPGTLTGLGNFVVGYNEDATEDDHRTGSHNLVVGEEHTYSSFGGFVASFNNAVTGPYTSVSGGSLNTASSFGSSVSGGSLNTASGPNSSVSGGFDNTASGSESSISGGARNDAVAVESSVSGGSSNIASGGRSSVSGGANNTASGPTSSVSGGIHNTASGGQCSVSGGRNRNASTFDSWAAGSLFEPN